MSKWEKVKLGKYALIAAGQSAPQGESCYSQEGRPFIKAGNLYGLTNGTKEDDILKVNEDIAKKYKLKMFPKDTIVFAKSGMSCLKGYIYLIQDDCYVVNHLACVLPNIKYLYPSYIKYFFIYSPVNKLIKDEAYPSIRLTDIGEIKIPLPPLDIQKKIAAALDTANALIEKRKEQIEKLDLLIKSQFIEMFGDPVTNPKGWEIKSIQDCCIRIFGGGTPSKQNLEYFTGDIPWVSPKDMKTLYIIDSIDHITKEAVEKSTTNLIPQKSVLMVIRSGILKKYLPVAINNVIITINQDMKAFTPNKNTKPEFLLYCFKAIERDVLSRVRSVTADNIEFSDFKRREIISPPLIVQNQFAEFVEKVEAQKTLLQKSLADMEQNYQSLLQKCFKGEIF